MKDPFSDGFEEKLLKYPLAARAVLLTANRAYHQSLSCQPTDKYPIRKEMQMKNISTVLAAILLIPAASAFAQITVQESQFQPIFRIGDSVTVLTILDTSLDVGAMGGPNRYDFSKVNYQTAKIASEPASMVPLAAAHFPGDTVFGGAGFYNVLSFSGGQLWGLGKIQGDNSSYKVVHRIPGEEIFSFPLTEGETWNYNMINVDTTFVSGYLQSSSADTNQRTTVIDGYGTLILPGGDSLQCLRITQGDANPSAQYDDSFFFVTQSGTFITINASRSGESAGVIGIGSAQIIEGNVATAVRTPHSVPAGFALYQNYPNPFNPSTAISYELSAKSQVSLKVYDVLGREVATLVDGEQNAGVYKVNFNAAGFASGVYFYRLAAVGNNGKTFSSVKKLMLMK
jgi:hypothetical protein